MKNKVCVVCKIVKSIDYFYNKYRECKQCNFRKITKRYYENKDKISMQKKKYIMKKIKINFYRNKTIIAKKIAQILKNYKDPMLNYKIK